MSSTIAGLLAQVTPGTDPDAAALLAYKRWLWSLTLSSPSAGESKVGLWAWLAGISAVLLLAIFAQGPRRALGQFLDLRGHARLFSAALGRLRRTGRLVAVLLGATVIAWTAWQTPLHAKTEKKEELGVLLNRKARAEVAIEQGELAGLTPLRDVLGLGDTWILLLGATALVFKFSADRWGQVEAPMSGSAAALTGWTTACWGGSGLYLLYRLGSLVYDSDSGKPLGGCLLVEAGVVPALMALSDAVILSWVLVELRGSPGGEEPEGFDVAGALAIAPASLLACLVGLPARYVASGLGLAVFYHLPANLIRSAWVSTFMKGWGLVGLQAGALAVVGVAGAAAWSRGTWGSALRGYGRMLRAEGGRLAATLALAGLAAGGLAGVAYYAVLALPAQPWVLLAADGYAHYATLPVGLIALAALVELGSARGDAGDSPWVDEGLVAAGEKAPGL